MNKYVIILLSSVFLASVSQVILKNSANKSYPSIIKEYLNIQVISGYALLVLSTVLTIYALKGVSYKSAPIAEATGYVYILLLSYFYLKEKITKKKIVGNIIIMIGVIVFNL